MRDVVDRVIDGIVIAFAVLMWIWGGDDRDIEGP